jgi:hypothetical protein
MPWMRGKRIERKRAERRAVQREEKIVKSVTKLAKDLRKAVQLDCQKDKPVIHSQVGGLSVAAANMADNDR